jgi:hypothetical protein
MSKEFVEIFRTDPNNVGDMFSNPLRYFAKGAKVHTVDITQALTTDYPDDVPVVVGGGGLIENEMFGHIVPIIAEGVDSVGLDNMWENRWICRNGKNEKIYNKFNDEFQRLFNEAHKSIKRNKGPKILWGAGHNQREVNKKDGELVWPRWMKEFDLVGVRDYLQGFNWVPCASCMHPAFDKKYEVTNKIVWFEHKKQLIKGAEFGSVPIPRIVNSGQNLEQTISILGSAEIVVTNSYHGVYWATLLGKKVICVDPWTSKFFYFRHMPVIARSRDWEDKLDKAVAYPNALNECREANINFWKQVQELVK